MHAWLPLTALCSRRWQLFCVRYGLNCPDMNLSSMLFVCVLYCIFWFLCLTMPSNQSFVNVMGSNCQGKTYLLRLALSSFVPSKVFSSRFWFCFLNFPLVWPRWGDAWWMWRTLFIQAWNVLVGKISNNKETTFQKGTTPMQQEQIAVCPQGAWIALVFLARRGGGTTQDTVRGVPRQNRPFKIPYKPPNTLIPTTPLKSAVAELDSIAEKWRLNRTSCR